MEKIQWNTINKIQNGLKQTNNEKSSTLPRDYQMLQKQKGQ